MGAIITVLDPKCAKTLILHTTDGYQEIFNIGLVLLFPTIKPTKNTSYGRDTEETF